MSYGKTVVLEAKVCINIGTIVNCRLGRLTKSIVSHVG